MKIGVIIDKFESKDIDYLGIVNAALIKREVEAVWFVPIFDSYDERFEKLRFLVKMIGKEPMMFVSQICSEIHGQKTVESILEMLGKENPDHELVLLER